jgi:CO dehydrogenase/acetyl-CoA synthase epsilon subunit
MPEDQVKTEPEGSTVTIFPSGVRTYTHALTQDKRTAQTKVVQMMLPKAVPPLLMAG